MVIKLKGLLVLFILVFFIGCGSKKSVVEKSSTKKSRRETPSDVKIKKQASIKQEDIQDIIKENDHKQQSNEQNENEEEVTNGLTATKEQSEDAHKKVTLKPNYTQEYINEFSSIAIEEMNIYRIPASITLAQGVLESGSGRSELALKSNNHFGIKCHKGWKGNSVSHDDDAIGECFRKYRHPKTSYEDHSKFLTSRSRYAKLFKLKLTDYVGWAYGLKKAGYATDKKYPNKLIAIIKKYNLQQYDSSESFVYSEGTSSVIASTQTHKVSKGDTLYSISRKYNISVAKLKKINALSDNTISIDQELLVP